MHLVFKNNAQTGYGAGYLGYCKILKEVRVILALRSLVRTIFDYFVLFWFYVHAVAIYGIAL